MKVNKIHSFVHYTSEDRRRMFCIGFSEKWKNFPEDLFLNVEGNEKIQPLSHSFDLLGGTLEKGETPKKCLLREIFEESCGTITSPTLLDEIVIENHSFYSVSVEKKDYFSSIKSFDENRQKVISSHFSKKEKAPFLEMKKLFWVEEDAMRNVFLKHFFSKKEKMAFDKLFTEADS